MTGLEPVQAVILAKECRGRFMALPPREWIIMERMYPEPDAEPQNSLDMARFLRVSPTRVRQLHKKACRKIRHWAES